MTDSWDVNGCYYKPCGARLGLEFNSGEDMSEFGSSTTKSHFKDIH